MFYLEKWLIKNILAYAKEQLPELGEFDIAVDAQMVRKNYDASN